MVKKARKKKVRLNFFYEKKLDLAEAEAVMSVLKSQQLTLLEGFGVQKFEKAFAEYMGVEHAVGVNSGTAALHVAIAAAGISTGDEVITSPFTFMASASSILHNNAIPVFADVQEDTLNIDPDDVRRKVTEKTKAIIPVHLAGLPADMDPILEIAREHDLVVIEDACQAHDAVYKGKKVGTMGDFGTFSFYPSKNMTTGEGGMVVTNNDEYAEQCRMVRHHGEREWYIYDRLGWNYRMTEIQAAIGTAQLKKLRRFVRVRKENGAYLNRKLEELGVEWVKPIKAPDDCEHSYNWWGARLQLPEGSNVDDYVNQLNKGRVELDDKILIGSAFTKPIYPHPLYATKVFQERATYKHGCPWTCPFYGGSVSYAPGSCPNVEKLCPVVIGVDMHPEITRDHLDYIAHRMKAIEES
ncbi:MAG: DegT/DnrJ/EryC1/StrS family aminotransferase [Promethearchaeota archaeon]